MTFVTDAGPADLERLAGVKWRAPTVECRVRFGAWQGAEIGIEACGKLWAVHVDSEKTADALRSFLAGFTVYGADVWRAITGCDVPHIAGAEVPELVDGAAAVAVEMDGTEKPMGKTVALAKLSAAVAAKEVEP